MKKVFTIMRWEYLERARSRIFLVSLVLMPVLMLSIGILPGLLAGRELARLKVIGVADMTGQLARSVAEHLESLRNDSGEPLYVVRLLAQEPPGDIAALRSEADSLVYAGDLEGYCLLEGRAGGGYLAEYRSLSAGDFLISERLREFLKGVTVEDTLSRLGLDPSVLAWLDASAEVSLVKLSGNGGEERYDEEGFIRIFFSAYVYLMMLFFMIVSSGQLLVRSVIEEKSNRIVEVLVSSCTPTELMAGKILGLSGLGLTQMLVWGTIAFLISYSLSFDLFRGTEMFLLLIYFVLGYLLYAGIFIAFGSPVTTEHEAQQVTGYLTMILVIPLVLTVPAMQNPTAQWIQVLTYIPLLTPTMMGLRLTLGNPPAMEIAVTIVILLLSIYLTMVVAGRIFRVAILATGKRPGMREIVSWIRGT